MNSLKKLWPKFQYSLVILGYTIYFCQPALAAPLPKEELRALNNWSNWVADNGGVCGSNTTANSNLEIAISEDASSNIPEPHRSVFVRAAEKYDVNPNYLAALFLSEQGNQWKPFNTEWASSSAGASGPMQFLSATWSSYGADGNNDGKKDIMNVEDAIFGAANLVSNGSDANSPLGNINKPWVAGTLLYNAGAYNWGIGNVSSRTNPSSPLSAGPEETENYLKNIYELLKSDFTKSGHPNYPDPSPSGDGGDGAQTNTTAYNTEISENCPSECSGSGGDGSTIVIDPGHGPGKTVIDPATKLKMVESQNQPEMQDAWEISQKLKTELETAGYTVLLTKDSVSDQKTFRERAEVANRANAALAISIHTDGGQPFGSFKEIYYQKVGGYRESVAGGKRTTFDNDSVASKSLEYANSFKAEREKIEGGSVQVKNGPGSLSRPGFSPGDMTMVQLFSKVPWVYHEVGSGPSSKGLSSSEKNKYEKGLLGGIKKILGAPSEASPSEGTNINTNPNCSNAAGAQKIVELALLYSWPESRGLEAKPEYVEGVKEFNSGRLGLLADCGTFVSTVILASGVDSDFPPGYTPAMEDYVKSNSDKWDVVNKVNSTADLQPGDVLIVNGSAGGSGANGHTYIYVGPQEPRGYSAASASLDSRMANLGDADVSDGRGDYIRARLK